MEPASAAGLPKLAAVVLHLPSLHLYLARKPMLVLPSHGRSGRRL